MFVQKILKNKAVKNQISFSIPSELQRQIHGGQDHRVDTGELGFETRQLD